MTTGPALRGVVTLHDGPTVWTLTFDMNAMCDFEGIAKISAFDFVASVDSGKNPMASHMRAMFWAALRQNHPNVTQEEAGRLMSSNPEALQEAMVAAFPEAEASADGGEPGKTKVTPE